MHHFQYKGNDLYCEDTRVADIAEEMKTPFYLYSHATLNRHFKAFDDPFQGMRHLICFSVKSNSNLAILRLLAAQGSGMDIVSGGELYRSLKAGVPPEKIVYSGVGKTPEDIDYALLSGILMFNTESEQELIRLDEHARIMGVKAGVSVRVNPDIDPRTHPYISTGLKDTKFGIDIKKSIDQYRIAAGLDNLVIKGISCHIGSQLTSVSPFVDALGRLKELLNRLEDNNIKVDYLDLGGGLGITYEEEKPPLPDEYAAAIKEGLGETGLTLILEPGRVIMGNAGILVTRVLYTKLTGAKNFIVVDAAMNDLIRPSLYGAYHRVQPVSITGAKKITADIVGPICESGDFLAKDREIDLLSPGDLIAVMSAGAYGFSMSSNYNSRPRVAEVMVRGDHYYIIREREVHEDLVRGEVIPDFLL